MTGSTIASIIAIIRVRREKSVAGDRYRFDARARLAENRANITMTAMARRDVTGLICAAEI